MRFMHSIVSDAERRVRTAVATAGLFGVLSLLLSLQSWRERLYWDLELVIGVADALLLLALAHGLARRSRASAAGMLLLTGAGAGYVLWQGLPAVALLPYALCALVYFRALLGLRELRRLELSTA